MDLKFEIKRKVFHNLSLLYLLLYWVTPRWFSLGLLGAALTVLVFIEWVRLRRPEVNAWLLLKFGGIHRPEEVMALSGIFWTLLGSWVTMFVFTNKRIVLPAMGCLAFGDTAAALIGRARGRHPWARNPSKSLEGSVAFAAVAALWATLFVRWPVAILGGMVGAWIEAQPFRWNDNFWVPVLSGAAFSVLNLALGR